MDRTTLTALIKPLAAKGWIKVEADRQDKRVRRLALTAGGHGVLTSAYPIWQATHEKLEVSGDALRAGLARIVDQAKEF
jgi:DNA-binding MarR family transcriptional regulator